MTGSAAATAPTIATTPSLTVLDLGVIASGSTAREAISSSLALAAAAEQFGYHRYWLAEHHLTSGLASSSPVPILAAIAARTTRIRIGSGATLTGHRTALSIAEDFAALAAIAPGRTDLGLGRSAGRGRESRPPTIPGLAARIARTTELLQQDDARSPDYRRQVGDVLDFLADEFRYTDGEKLSAFPGGAPDVETWLLGSSAGTSAIVAGELGLPFAANHHMNPGTALAAVEQYRACFTPGRVLTDPYVAVSAEVFLADSEAAAATGARRHLEWVRRQRTGEGLRPFPNDREAQAHNWTENERERVADRASSFVWGTADRVVDRLSELAARFGANEIVVTTQAHDPGDVLRSFELLAAQWPAHEQTLHAGS